jgi:hypothetical protein
LDSICPTGAGKVAGVKIEIDDEKGAGGVEGLERLDLLCVAVEGIREKTQPPSLKASARQDGATSRRGKQKTDNSRNFDMGSRKDDRSEAGFSGRQLVGKSHGQNGSPLVADGSEWFTWFELWSAAINGNGREKTRMAHTQGNVFDHIFPTKPPRIGEAVHVGKKGLRFAGSVLGFVQFGAVAEDGPVLKTLLEP